MTDTENPNAAQSSNAAQPTPDPVTVPARSSASWGKRLMLAGALGVSFLAGGLAMTVGHAQGFGWGHGGPMGMTDRSDRQAMSRFMLDRALDKVKATAEQKQKIEDIVEKTMTELEPTRELGRATRTEMVKLLTAPTIDRTAIETLRTARLADADAISKKVLTSLADAAEVLSADQRAELAKLMQRNRPE